MHSNTSCIAAHSAKQAMDTASQTIEAIKVQYGEAAADFVKISSGALIRAASMARFINMLGSEIEDPLARLRGELLKISMNNIMKNMVADVVSLSQEAHGLTDDLAKEYFDMATEIAEKVIDSAPKSDKD